MKSGKASFLTPTHIEHEVGGKILRFRAVSIKTAFSVRQIAVPLAKALTTLFASNSNDFGSIERVIPDGEKFMREVQVQAVSPEMAKLRDTMSGSAVESLVTSLTSDGSLNAIAEVILDSLQDEESFGPSTVEEFLSEVPLPLLPSMLVGVAKANKGVFGPLADQVEEVLGKVREKIVAKVSPPPAPASAESSPDPTQPNAG
mgnify:CR=1 FL=1